MQRHAEELGVGYINLKGFPIGPEVLTLIPEPVSRELQTIAFLYGNGQIRIGSVDPTNEHVLSLIENISADLKANVEPYFISPHSYELAAKLYAAVPKVKKFTAGVQVSAEDLRTFQREIHSIQDIANKLGEVSMTQIITLLIAGAIISRSSDVHV